MSLLTSRKKYYDCQYLKKKPCAYSKKKKNIYIYEHFSLIYTSKLIYTNKITKKSKHTKRNRKIDILRKQTEKLHIIIGPVSPLPDNIVSTKFSIILSRSYKNLFNLWAVLYKMRSIYNNLCILYLNWS